MRADCPEPVIPWIDLIRNDASEILKFFKFAATATKPFIWYQYHRSPPFIRLDDYHRNSDQRDIRFQTIFWEFSMASIKGVGAFVIRRNDL